MGIRTTLIAQTYAATDLITRLAGLALNDRLHPGKRTCRALRHMRDAPSGPYFARAVFASRVRSSLLFDYLLSLSHPQMRTFLEDKVEYEGAVYAQNAFNANRPVIFAAPHFGAAPVAFLAAIHQLGGRKPLSIFYDTKQPKPARFVSLFERGGMDATTLLGGFSGAVAAIRALARHECVVVMPDSFDDITQTVVVPFFGRMLRVARGTAYFALKTAAWILPVFAAPTKRLGLRVTIGRPLDAQRFQGMDSAQAIFLLSRALFVAFEREIRRAPEHWHHWERLPQTSTEVQAPGRLEEDTPLRLLRDKCEMFPHLLLDLPELELLVK